MSSINNCDSDSCDSDSGDKWDLEKMLFNSLRDIGVDLCKDIDNIINGYVNEYVNEEDIDNENCGCEDIISSAYKCDNVNCCIKDKMGVCSICEEVDILKIYCLDCEVGYCGWCLTGEREDEIDTCEVCILWNSDIDSWVCYCELNTCSCCDNEVNSQDISNCEDCKNGFCCDIVEDCIGNMICLDCLGNYVYDEYGEGDTCDKCGVDIIELNEIEINIYRFYDGDNRIIICCGDCL